MINTTLTSPLSVEAAGHIYDVLCLLGANPEHRSQFLTDQSLEFVGEWRFRGRLGRGGKFRRSGSPEPAWHGRWYGLGSPGTEYVAESLVEYLQGHEDELRRISAAYLGSEWDGSNHRGRWADHIGDEAQWFDMANVASYWDACDWFQDLDADSLLIDYSTLTDAVAGEIDNARSESTYLEPDEVESVLRSKASLALDRAERELELADDDDREDAEALLAKYKAFLANE